MNRASHPVEQEEVMAYLDGELGAARAATVAGHLHECAGCADLAAELCRVSQRMVDWQVGPSPERLNETVARAIVQQARQNKPREAKQPSASEPERRLWRSGWVAKTAAVLGVIVLLLSLLISRVREELDSHRTAEFIGARGQMTPQDARSRSSETRVAPVDRMEPERPTGSMIIRTATVILVAKEFEGARTAMERIVREHGGYLAQLTVSEQARMARTLSATVRVPAAQLDAVLAAVKNLGRIEQESQSAEEVTRQYVDLAARLANARATEKRLIQVLEQRTGKVGDVLEVEREIARVRGEIERMDAERKNMEKQVQFATLQFQLREDFQAKLELSPPSTGTRMWNALAEGYRSALETALGIVLLLLSSGPMVLFWLAILFWPARLVWRRVRPRLQP